MGIKFFTALQEAWRRDGIRPSTMAVFFMLQEVERADLRVVSRLRPDRH